MRLQSTGPAAIPWRIWLWTSGVAVVAGAIYALSPMTVWMAPVIGALWYFALHGLTGAERRWVLRALVVAFALRIVAIAALVVATSPEHEPYRALFGDGRFVITRALWIRDYWLGGRLAPDVALDIFDPYGGDAYFYFFALIQRVVGPAPYALNLFTIAFILAAAIALHRLARLAYGAFAGFVVLVLVLFAPTIFAWSVSMLKESLVILLITSALAAAFWTVRSPQWRVRGIALAGGAVAMAVLHYLRPGGLVLALGGVAVGLTAWLVTRRAWVMALVAIVAVGSGRWLLTNPAVVERVTSQVQLAANRHIGHVFTEGRAYKLLDDRFYVQGSESTFQMKPGEIVRFLVRAAVAFVIIPLPSRAESRSELLYIPIQLAWYVMVLLAIPGAFVGARHEPLLTWLLIGYSCAALAVIGPNSGNVGTLIRHRDMVVPFVGCLSAVGLRWSIESLLSFGRILEPRPTPEAAHV